MVMLRTAPTLRLRSRSPRAPSIRPSLPSPRAEVQCDLSAARTIPHNIPAKDTPSNCSRTHNCKPEHDQAKVSDRGLQPRPKSSRHLVVEAKDHWMDQIKSVADVAEEHQDCAVHQPFPRTGTEHQEEKQKSCKESIHHGQLQTCSQHGLA